eukprot:866144-Rhodomonas_salina.5
MRPPAILTRRLRLVRAGPGLRGWSQVRVCTGPTGPRVFQHPAFTLDFRCHPAKRKRISGTEMRCDAARFQHFDHIGGALVTLFQVHFESYSYCPARCPGHVQY